MRPITAHYDRTALIKRMEPVSEGSEKKALALHIEEYPCHIQPFEDKFSEDMQGSFGKDFLMFGAVADIQQGDRVFLNDTKEYRVVSVESFSFRCVSKHMECRIRIFE